MSCWNFMLSWVEHETSFIASRPHLPCPRPIKALNVLMGSVPIYYDTIKEYGFDHFPEDCSSTSFLLKEKLVSMHNHMYFQMVFPSKILPQKFTSIWFLCSVYKAMWLHIPNLAKIPATLQNAPNFQYPGQLIVPIHHFCMKTDLSVWVIIWILKWSFLLKSLPQNLQVYGFSPVWIRLWVFIFKILLKFRPQSHKMPQIFNIQGK